MREIRVFFRKTNDPPPGGHRIDVQQDPTFARKGEAIVWHLYSLDPEIDWALVRFDDENAGYFRTRVPADNKQHYRMTRFDNGSSQILGTGPKLGNGGPLREHKYSIEGWSGQPPDPGNNPANGSRQVVKLDPMIIIGDP